MTQLIFGASLMLWLTVSFRGGLFYHTTMWAETDPHVETTKLWTWRNYTRAICKWGLSHRLIFKLVDDRKCSAHDGSWQKMSRLYVVKSALLLQLWYIIFVCLFLILKKIKIFHVLLQFMSIAWDFRSTHLHCYFYHKVTGNVHWIVSGCLISTQTLTLIRLKRRQIQMMLSLLLWRWQTVPSST